MYNIWHFAGRLGADPIDRSKAGRPMASFNVALHVREPGSEERATHWLDCLAFGRSAQRLLAEGCKGAQVLAHGSLRPKLYTDKQGVQRPGIAVACDYVVVVQDGVPRDSQATVASPAPAPAPRAHAPDPYAGYEDW